MDTKLRYKIILDDKTKRQVTGFQITEHFAADQRREGWAVTHLPTGRALVLSFFQTIEDAKNFSQGYESVFGDLLDGNGDINTKSKKGAPEAILSLLTKPLNRNPKVFTMPEIERLSKRVYDYA